MRRSSAVVALTNLVGVLWLRQNPAGHTAGTSPAADSVVQMTYQSHILGQERELIIHLPSGYDPTRRYPVLYVLDGSSQDQPLADKLDSLFGQGLVPQTIVVGIPNMSGSNRTLQLVPPFMLTDPANPGSPRGRRIGFWSSWKRSWSRSSHRTSVHPIRACLRGIREAGFS